MIRARAVAVGIAALAVGAVFSLRPSDPVAADPARAAAQSQAVEAAASDAAIALKSLLDALRVALDQARRGAAAVASGDALPGPRFEDSATAVREASPALDVARDALADLRRRLAISATGRAPSLALESDELASLAAQLDATAPPADAFASMRRSTENALARLRDALASLAADDLAPATGSLASARDSLSAVRAWDGRLPTLSIWLDTTDQLVASLTSLVDARAAGNAAAERRATAAYALAAQGASRADRALAVAMADGAGLIAAAPLERLARAVAEAEATADDVAPLVHR